MSRSSKNITKYNNLKTSPGRFVTKRSTRVFGSGPPASVVDSVLLYQLVFRSKKAVFMALFLCLCFATQSVKLAQASEEESVSTQAQMQTDEIVTEQIPKTDIETKSTAVALENNESEVVDSGAEPEAGEVVPEPESEPAQGPLDADSAQINEDSSTTTESAVGAGSSATTTNPNTSESETSSTTQNAAEPEAGNSTINTATATDATEPESSATSTDTEYDVESNASTTESSASTAESNDDGNAEPADTVQQDLGAESDGGTSGRPVEEPESIDDDENYVREAPTTSNENLVFTVESDTHFSFNKNECTRIEDGTFYCQERNTETALADSLIAAPDSGGDLEIYLVRDGERYQITQNEVDDASPYYDERSNTIVWHRLLNDRYQIISYDIESGEEEQLTQTSVNNMEPARHGEYTVWQRWVENNWEIILYDSKTETQITDSARHDIAPHIRGPLVIWNSQSNDGSQELRTFDIQSRTQTTITDSEGVSVSNPRMVVMYEAMYENGDIVTKGFDLVSGKIVPLQALPKQLPEELPNSEPTEETRALIQNKPEPKATSISQVQTSGGNGTSTSTATSTTPTVENATSSVQTLDLRSLSTPELIKHLTEKDVSTSMIPDVVIESEQSGTTTQSEVQADIPDLVISPTNSPQTVGTSTQMTSD